MIKIGTKLEKGRKAIGISQRDLSKKLGITESYYSHLKHNERVPSFALLLKIKKVLSVDLI